jgi:NAD(P)-dependent dehydrogenase (short-subunit alcohol dehydrogenase family)
MMKISLSNLQNRLGGEIDSAACYAHFERLGFQYGPAFQAIAGLRRGVGEVLARIRVPAPIEPELDAYHLHPVILDACFQLLLALTMEGGKLPGAFLPTGASRIRVFGRQRGEMWCHARFAERNESAIAANLTLFDGDGTVLVEVAGFRAEALSPDQSASMRSTASWLYEPIWDELAGSTDRAPGVPGHGAWLILADRKGLGDQVAAVLEAAGEEVLIAFAGDRYEEDGVGRLTLRPEVTEDWDRLLEVMPQGKEPARLGVVHLWALDTDQATEPTPEDVDRAQDRGTRAVLRLFQALERHALSPRLWIATRGAQPVVKPLGPGALSQAPLWGMGRVMHQESLALQTALIDLDPDPRDGEAATLAAELMAPCLEDQLAVRDGRRFAPRLQATPTRDSVLPCSLRPGSAYLVTGGFGSLGMHVARWLVHDGARHLILLSRSALPPRAEWSDLKPEDPQAEHVAFIREIEGLGASVHVASLDIADGKALSGFLDNYRREGWPPIRGVIHSAGIVRDQILTRMDLASFDAVMRPKVLGGMVLHECFKDAPLDFFVLFSSIASLIVTTGQSNYAAGNAFLDALAHYRRARDLPAMTINWGPWKVGMIAQLNLEALYTARGIAAIRPGHGMQILENLLGRDPIQAAVISADWRVLVDSYPIVPQMIRHLADADKVADPATATETCSFAERLAGSGPSERRPLLVEHCRELTSRVLRIEPSHLDVDVALNTVGLDSMTALELRIRLDKSVGIAPSVVEILKGLSISQLAALLDERLAGTPDTSTPGLDELVSGLDDATLGVLLDTVTAPPDQADSTARRENGRAS